LRRSDGARLSLSAAHHESHKPESREHYRAAVDFRHRCNCAGRKQTVQTNGIGGVAKVCNPSEWIDAEDVLQCTQIVRVSKIDEARERDAIHIRMCKFGDYDLRDGVIEVVLVAGTVLLGLIKSDDDCAIVLMSLGGHDLRHDEPQEVVTLRDLGCA